MTSAMRESKASYFAQVSDSIAAGEQSSQRAEGKSWGLIAALLGNSDNRRAFMFRFWNEKRQKEGEEPDPMRLRSLRSILNNKEMGTPDWSEVRREFHEALARTENRVAGLEKGAKLFRAIQLLRAQVKEAEMRLPALYGAQQAAAELESSATRDAIVAKQRLDVALEVVEAQTVVNGASQVLSKLRAAAALLPTPSASAATLANCQSDVANAVRLTDLTTKRKPSFWSFGEKKSWREDMKASAKSEVNALAALSLAKTVASKVSMAAAAEAAALVKMDAAESVRDSAVSRAQACGLDEVFSDVSLSALQHHSAHARSMYFAEKRRSEDAVRAVQQNEADLIRIKRDHTGMELEFTRICQELGQVEKGFFESCDLHCMEDEPLQLTVPHDDTTLRQLRVEVFRLAMKVNELFVICSWPRLRATLSAFVDYQGGVFSARQAGPALSHLWDAFFTVVPVVSSTFASIGNLFAGLGSEELGLLLIDEAGQSTPQNALGAIWRAKRVIAVGDPLQLKPVVPQPTEVIWAWRDWVGADRTWTPPACSTQVLADQMTPYGTMLDIDGSGDRMVWVGSPLRVHRRCLNPMFDAANKIAYGGLMVHSVQDKTEHDDWIGHSRWFDVGGSGQGHWIQEQGDFTIDLIGRLLATEKLDGVLRPQGGPWHIAVITPFKEVSDQFGGMLENAFKVAGIREMAGTVHTFQGKEADVVILLLGGDPQSAGAVSGFAGNAESPNLLNVALTRAKRRIYVVGDKGFWTRNSSTFRLLSQQLDSHRDAKLAQLARQ
jgi:hypothetical protein